MTDVHIFLRMFWQVYSVQGCAWSDPCDCSIGVDRLTFSVIWEMTGEGHILKQWCGRTVIRSCAKLAYDHAQDMVEGSFDASKAPVALSAPHTWDQVCACNKAQ